MLNRTFRVCSFHLRQALEQPKMLLILLLESIFIYSTTRPVTTFAIAMGMNVGPWAFPHLTGDFICQLVIICGLVFAFCDAPFENGAHMYIQSRAGEIAWTFGTCVYIAVMSFLYLSCILIVSILALIPQLNFDSGWGKIWSTLARTTAGMQYGMIIAVNDYIIGAYNPIEATITAFLLEWACCIWLGLVIYLFNRISGTPLGCFIAAGFALLDIAIWNEWSYVFYRISPLTMAQLSAISRPESLYGLSKNYAISFFVVGIVILTSACIILPTVKWNKLTLRKGNGYAVDTVLSVRNIVKIYGQQKVLDNVSLDCEAGKIYGLVGRNGSGKTVLLKCICGLTCPTDGAVYVLGKQIGRDIDFPEHTGFIIERPGFLLHETGFKNLRYLASIQEKISADQIRNCMELVGLDPDLKKPVGKYSLGMRQRLGIAQAIMEKPLLLILDEPTNGLDNQGIHDIRNLIKGLAKNGVTVILASHSREDIDTLCDTVFRINSGRLCTEAE